MAKKPHKRKPKSPGKPAEIRISMPDGKHLRFSESLVSFVVNRPEEERRRGFRLGDWLVSLDGDMLVHLGVLSEQAMLGVEPPQPAGEDLLAVAVHAVSAERGVRQVKFSEDKAQEWLLALCVGSALERFRRDGLVEFDGRTSILKPPGDVTFTAKGMDWQRQSGGVSWMN